MKNMICFIINNVNIFLDNILIMFDEIPILFVCKDAQDEYYLSYLYFIPNLTYIVTKISKNMIDLILKNGIPIFDVYMSSDTVYEITANCDIQNDTVRKLGADEIKDYFNNVNKHTLAMLEFEYNGVDKYE